MTNIYTPQSSITIFGSSFTGTDGDQNRTYTISTSGAVDTAMSVIVGNNALNKDSTGFSFSSGVLTIFPEVWDNQSVTIDYYTLTSPTFSGTVMAQLRLMVIQIDDDTQISDDVANFYLELTSASQSSTVTLAIVAYAAHLLVDQWQGIGFITRLDGTSIQRTDSKSYLNLYNSILKKNDPSSPFVKVSTNKGFVVDNTTNHFKRGGTVE